MKKSFNWMNVVIVILVVLVIFLAVQYFGITLEEIIDQIGYIITIISMLSLVVGFYAKMTGNAKAAKLAKDLNAIGVYAEEAVELAEDFASQEGMGKEKKWYALTYINQKCIENGIDFDEAVASELIEKFVSLSQKVNARHEKEQGGEVVL